MINQAIVVTGDFNIKPSDGAFDGLYELGACRRQAPAWRGAGMVVSRWYSVELGACRQQAPAWRGAGMVHHTDIMVAYSRSRAAPAATRVSAHGHASSRVAWAWRRHGAARRHCGGIQLSSRRHYRYTRGGTHARRNGPPCTRVHEFSGDSTNTAALGFSRMGCRQGARNGVAVIHTVCNTLSSQRPSILSTLGTPHTLSTHTTARPAALAQPDAGTLL